MSSGLYNIKNENIFAKAEPYRYGKGYPEYNYFLPIGEDEDPKTSDDIKIQDPTTDNKFSELAKIDNYKINGKSLQYIVPWTFPKISTDTSKVFTRWWDSDHDEYIGNVSVIASYDANNQICNMQATNSVKPENTTDKKDDSNK